MKLWRDSKSLTKHEILEKVKFIGQWNENPSAEYNFVYRFNKTLNICWSLFPVQNSAALRKLSKTSFLSSDRNIVSHNMINVIFSWWAVWLYSYYQFSAVTQSCLILCDPMDCSTPGLPVHHQLPELTQTHVHWVGDAIQPSHPLSSPSPPAFNLSQHQGLFKWVSSLYQVAKVFEFQLQH